MVELSQLQAELILNHVKNVINNYVAHTLPEDPTEEDLLLRQYVVEEPLEETLSNLADSLYETVMNLARDTEF